MGESTHRAVNKNGYNTTLFPGGPPPQYWAGSNRVNFRDRTRTGALRLIWSYPRWEGSAWNLFESSIQMIQKLNTNYTFVAMTHTFATNINFLLLAIVIAIAPWVHGCGVVRCVCIFSFRLLFLVGSGEPATLCGVCKTEVTILGGIINDADPKTGTKMCLILMGTVSPYQRSNW